MQTVDVDPEMPLLWALRDNLGLVAHQIRLRRRILRRLHGPRGRRLRRGPARCPSGKVAGRAIITIEGLAAAPALHPVQRAWTELDVRAMRLLPGRANHDRRGAPHAHAESHRRADRERHEGICADAAPTCASAMRSAAPPRSRPAPRREGSDERHALAPIVSSHDRARQRRIAAVLRLAGSGAGRPRLRRPCAPTVTFASTRPAGSPSGPRIPTWARA